VTVRALVVDDSALMRQTLTRILDAAADVEVIATASNGLDALSKIEALRPDVVTMDVQMPRLDGLAALDLLMQRFPVPVVMLSSLTDAGTEAAVRALALGAVDYVAKPSPKTGLGISSIAEELIEKVKRAARAQVRKRPSIARPAVARDGPPPRTERAGLQDLLVIGASTGGPRALAEVLGGLPADLPCAVVVVQHLPAGFTRSLANRLNETCPLSVAEAEGGQRVTPGQVLVAPGDFHLTLRGDRVALDQGARRHGVRPSIDTTLESVARAFGRNALAIILTGMGEDGAMGACALKAAGGAVWAEAESTCVVFGMPRAVIEADGADRVLPLDQMAPEIVKHLARAGAARERRLSLAR